MILFTSLMAPFRFDFIILAKAYSVFTETELTPLMEFTDGRHKVEVFPGSTSPQTVEVFNYETL